LIVHSFLIFERLFSCWAPVFGGTLSMVFFFFFFFPTLDLGDLTWLIHGSVLAFLILVELFVYLKEVCEPGTQLLAVGDTGGAQPAGATRRPPTPLKLAAKMRPSSPKSPVQGNGSYESVEGSEEEDHLPPNDDEDTYNEEEDDEEDAELAVVVDGERNGGSELVSLPAF
jgi:hypothetical protein